MQRVSGFPVVGWGRDVYINFFFEHAVTRVISKITAGGRRGSVIVGGWDRVGCVDITHLGYFFSTIREIAGQEENNLP